MEFVLVIRSEITFNWINELHFNLGWTKQLYIWVYSYFNMLHARINVTWIIEANLFAKLFFCWKCLYLRIKAKFFRCLNRSKICIRQSLFVRFSEITHCNWQLQRSNVKPIKCNWITCWTNPLCWIDISCLSRKNTRICSPFANAIHRWIHR